MASLQWLARPSEISTSITFLQYSPPNLLYSHHSHLIAVQKLWGRSCLWAFAPAAFSVWSALPPVNPQLTRFLPSETFYHFPSDHKLCTPPSLLHCSLSCLNIPSACTEYKECFFFLLLLSLICLLKRLRSAKEEPVEFIFMMDVSSCVLDSMQHIVKLNEYLL